MNLVSKSSQEEPIGFSYFPFILANFKGENQFAKVPLVKSAWVDSVERVERLPHVLHKSPVVGMSVNVAQNLLMIVQN